MYLRLSRKKMIKCAVLAIKKWGRFGKITFILKNSGGVLVKKRGRFDMYSKLSMTGEKQGLLRYKIR